MWNRNPGVYEITFWGQMLHWTGWFLMKELKRSWQCWHSCIVERLWKTYGPFTPAFSPLFSQLFTFKNGLRTHFLQFLVQTHTHTHIYICHALARGGVDSRNRDVNANAEFPFWVTRYLFYGRAWSRHSVQWSLSGLLTYKASTSMQLW